MFYVVLALALFSCAVGAHIIFCRFQVKTQLHAKAFIGIALLFWAAYGAGAYIVSHSNWFDRQGFWGLSFGLSAGFIYVLLIPVYLSFYCLTQLMSPSKRILLSLRSSNKLSEEQIIACVQADDFIGTRLADLCVSGCVVLKEGRYQLTHSGRSMAHILNVMQLMYGRDTGG